MYIIDVQTDFRESIYTKRSDEFYHKQRKKQTKTTKTRKKLA